jgi:feruloyl-CoA synthase
MKLYKPRGRCEVRRVASWLIGQDVSRERPIAILSDNSVSHATLALAAMQIGSPVMPISPAYSLMSRDYAKLRSILELTKPSVIYVESFARFEPALTAIADAHDALVIESSEALAALPPGGREQQVQAALCRALRRSRPP